MSLPIIQLDKPDVQWHQSHALDTVRQKRNNSRAAQLDEAVQWCKENECRGFAAIKSGLFPFIRDARIINARLDGKVQTGQEKRYCSILIKIEEE